MTTKCVVPPSFPRNKHTQVQTIVGYALHHYPMITFARSRSDTIPRSIRSFIIRFLTYVDVLCCSLPAASRVTSNNVPSMFTTICLSRGSLIGLFQLTMRVVDLLTMPIKRVMRPGNKPASLTCP